ncbi:MAG: M15 family metallopeptidase [Lachnospiraceae bacterium]|nr:M15 family metallopeptidase [Lachnospiraceae bacterium]
MKTVRYILIALWVILCVACVGTCAVLSFCYLKLEEDYTVLQEDNIEKDAQITVLQSELAEAESYSAALESEQAVLLQAETESLIVGETEQESLNVGGIELQTEDSLIETVRELQPGDIISDVAAGDDVSGYFSSVSITVGDDVYNRIYGKSYRENDNVSLEDLRYLTLLHYNFNHEVQVGEMIVHKNIEDKVLAIFEELFQAEYEIQSIYLIDNYWTGDADTTDSASIEQNNTSCFNYRAVTGGSSLSKHAYGCAIDINPQQNPYVWYTSDGTLAWSHSNANDYIDRTSGNAHVIVSGDICCSTFEKYGFSWGGYWSNPIDYQHFEIEAY